MQDATLEPWSIIQEEIWNDLLSILGMIAASAGNYAAMHNLLVDFEQGLVSRNAIDSTLTAYNNSCVEMRSEARDSFIRTFMVRN